MYLEKVKIWLEINEFLLNDYSWIKKIYNNVKKNYLYQII